MAQVRVTEGAVDLGAVSVARFAYIFDGDGLREAGPSGHRIEFGVGVEEGQLAAYAAVDSVRMVVPGCTCERTLGGVVPGYLERVWGELATPFRICFDDGWDGDGAGGRAVGCEFDDRDRVDVGLDGEELVAAQSGPGHGCGGGEDEGASGGFHGRAREMGLG